MFYSSQLLSRKTALGVCWLASHLEGKRLKRTQVFEVSIEDSCKSIVDPAAPLALRLSGQLLLGVVRIYQRKLQYLETDAKNAIDGLQRTDGSSQNVDLPDGGTAPEMAITMPDTDAAAVFGSELFPTFTELPGLGGGGGGGGGAPGALGRFGADSLTLADDISDVFGSRWTASEQRFDAPPGEDIDRRFSAELERLRSQVAVEAPNASAPMFYDGADEGTYGAAPDFADDSMMMAPPPADMFAEPPASAGPTPGSAGGAPGGGAGLTPPSLGFDDVLPELGGADEAGPSGEGSRGAPSPGPAGHRQRRKKRAQLDVGPDGRPATQLDTEEIKLLLHDSAPLLRRRGMNAADLEGMEAPPRMFDVRAQSEAARESFLYRPACYDRLAPHLLEVFSRALGAQGGRLPDHARRAPRRAPAGAAEPRGDDDGGGGAFGAFGAPASPPRSAGGAPSPGYFDDDDGGGGGDMGPPDDDDDDDGFEPVQDGIEGSPPPFGGAPGSAGPAPGSGGARLGELSLLRAGAAPGDGFLAEEAAPGSAGDGPGGHGGYARDGFTHRTRAVLGHLHARLGAPAAGGKRRHPSSAAAPAGGSVTLDAVVQGKSRLEACRWFFEALVLKNKRFVDLRQDTPYGAITITPLDRMLSPAGPAPGSRPASAGGAAVSSG